MNKLKKIWLGPGSWLNNSILAWMIMMVWSTNSAANEINIMVDDTPPYVEQTRADHGVITALVVEAFKRVDVSSKVSFANWSRVEQNIDDNRAISFMWSKSKPLMKKWVYSEPIYQQKKKLAVLTPYQPDIQHIHNLRGIKLGLTAGFRYGSKLENIRHKLVFKEFESDYKTIQALFEEKVAMIIIDPPVATDLANKYFSGQQRKRLSFIDTDHFDSTNYYLVCAKRYGNCINYIKKFNQGLALIKQDGSDRQFLMKAEQIK